MKDAGSLASNSARLGLGQGTLREPCGGNHTVTHSIKLINDILYIMRVGFPCGPLRLSSWRDSSFAAAAGTYLETNKDFYTSGCVKVIL